MMILNKNDFFTDETEKSAVSAIVNNPHGDTLAIEVIGDLGGGVLYLEGRNSKKAEWQNIAGVSLSTLDIATEGITNAGLYEFPILSIRSLRTHIENNAGVVSVIGHIINSTEV